MKRPANSFHVLSNLTGFSETMALTLVVWLCSLLLVGLVIFPLFGSKVALATGLGLLIALLAVCWGVCGYHAANNRR
jgi:hypothetical protein